MPHIFRFIAELTGDRSWEIRGDEWTHLTKILKLTIGSPVEVMDGLGHWGVGLIVELSGKRAVVEVEKTNFEDAPTTSTILITAALKPGSVDDVIGPLTELGVDEIWVFLQDHTSKNRLNAGAEARWERILLAACKQCTRARLPRLRVFENLARLLETTEEESCQRYFLDPKAPASLLEVRGVHERVAALIGGEKGLDAKECADLIQAGYRPMRLGRHVLRATTAAVAAATILTLRQDVRP